MTAPRRTSGNRLLGPGYAQALRVFVSGEACWLDIAATCGTGRAASQALCHGMRRQKLIHVARWERRTGCRSSWTPVYAFGPGVNAPDPTLRSRSTKPTPPELLAFCDLVQAMQGESWHAKGLAEHLGHCERTVRRTMKALHALRLVHIDDYMHRANGGVGYPLFTWGPDLQDAVKPRPMSKKALWTRNNALQAGRRRQASLLHEMVRGVSLDGRRRTAAEPEVEAVA